MALSKSVNYFVNTIYYDPIAIGNHRPSFIVSLLPEFLAFCQNIFETVGAAAPPPGLVRLCLQSTSSLVVQWFSHW